MQPSRGEGFLLLNHANVYKQHPFTMGLLRVTFGRLVSSVGVQLPWEETISTSESIDVIADLCRSWESSLPCSLCW